MQPTPLHPLIVHLPMALAVVMPLISLGLLFAWWRGVLPRRSWGVVFLLQLVLVGSAVLALRSGEEDEERVEHVVSEELIEEHEEAAELFTWTAGFILALSLLPLVLRDERRARGAALLGVAGSFVVLGLGYRVGSAGGELVYRHGAATAWVQDAQAAPGGPVSWRGGEHDDDDDHDDD